jgi:hypothetical protein
MSTTTSWRPWYEPGGDVVRPVPIEIEQGDPGGVSWQTRNDSPADVSRSTWKPHCSL